jgi:hypothetical protein
MMLFFGPYRAPGAGNAILMGRPRGLEAPPALWTLRAIGRPPVAAPHGQAREQNE